MFCRNMTVLAFCYVPYMLDRSKRLYQSIPQKDMLACILTKTMSFGPGIEKQLICS